MQAVMVHKHTHTEDKHTLMLLQLKPPEGMKGSEEKPVDQLTENYFYYLSKRTTGFDNNCIKAVT